MDQIYAISRLAERSVSHVDFFACLTTFWTPKITPEDQEMTPKGSTAPKNGPKNDPRELSDDIKNKTQLLITSGTDIKAKNGPVGNRI
jgi:hypothetical protein